MNIYDLRIFGLGFTILGVALVALGDITNGILLMILGALKNK